MQFGPRNTGPPSGCSRPAAMASADLLLDLLGPLGLAQPAGDHDRGPDLAAGDHVARDLRHRGGGGGDHEHVHRLRQVARRSARTRTPSIAFSFSLTTYRCSGGKPQFLMLLRMMRPKFIAVLDTPSTAIARGSSSRRTFSIGRGGGRLAAVPSRPRPSSGTMRCWRKANGLTSSSAMSGPSAPRSMQKCRAIEMNARKQRSSSPSDTMRRWPRARPGRNVVRGGLLEQLQELLGGGVRGAGLGDGDAGPHLGGQVLGVDAAEARRDDRAELARGADADEQLVAEARLRALDELDDQHAGDARPRGVPGDQPLELAPHGLVVLGHEDDPVGLGLVR